MIVTVSSVGEATRVSRVEFNPYEPVVHDQTSLWLKLLKFARDKAHGLADQACTERSGAAIRFRNPGSFHNEEVVIEDPESVLAHESAAARWLEYGRLHFSAERQAAAVGVVVFEGSDAQSAYDALMLGTKVRHDDYKMKTWGAAGAGEDMDRILAAISYVPAGNEVSA